MNREEIEKDIIRILEKNDADGHTGGSDEIVEYIINLLNQKYFNETKERVRTTLAKELYVALISNPARYNYINDQIDGIKISKELATQENIDEAFRLADAFIEHCKTL